MPAVNERLQELLDNLQLAADRRLYRHKDFFVPYPKQEQFMAMGSFKRERLLMAGNQTGKTEIGAFEVACHLTGEYPEDWLGKRWERPVKGWAAGVTGQSTRDVVQKKLCGEPEDDAAFGTGMIPREAFAQKPTLARGITGLYDKLIVKHKSGGNSVLILKSYEQGRKKWQGDTLDFVWFDEEPPPDIYDEGLTRLRGDGMAFLTFTPLDGPTDVVLSFTDADKYQKNPNLAPKANGFDHLNNWQDKGLVMMSIDDITHFTDEEKAKRVAGYKDYEREARANGTPLLGSGRIFQVPESMIVEDPIPLDKIPSFWSWLWGIDFGTQHPFGAVLAAWDKEADCIHIVHTVRMANAMRIQHAQAMLPFGWIRVAWPHDGERRDGDLTPIAKLYAKDGLRMLDEHAHFPDGSISTEAAIQALDERMKSGRFKVARHLADWWEEFRLYHRKDGVIVKVRDDLMSATQKIVMDLRHASLRIPKPSKRTGQTMAIGHDDPPF